MPRHGTPKVHSTMCSLTNSRSMKRVSHLLKSTKEMACKFMAPKRSKHASKKLSKQNSPNDCSMLTNTNPVNIVTA